METSCRIIPHGYNRSKVEHDRIEWSGIKYVTDACFFTASAEGLLVDACLQIRFIHIVNHCSLEIPHGTGPFGPPSLCWPAIPAYINTILHARGTIFYIYPANLPTYLYFFGDVVGMILILSCMSGYVHPCRLLHASFSSEVVVCGNETPDAYYHRIVHIGSVWILFERLNYYWSIFY